MKALKSLRSQGFTIVELTIVIVVIAILAAIVTVGYNGIKNNAHQKVVQSNLNSLASDLALEMKRNGKYPAQLGSAALNDEKVNYTYWAAGDQYCITGTSKANSSIVFFIGEDGKVGEGACGAAPEEEEEGGGGGEVATHESCFAFNAGTQTINDYYDHQSNNAANPACPRNVVIPAQIGGTDVAIIGDSSFYDKGLTAVTLPSTLELIGETAFTYNSLTTVTIPDGVTIISREAFLSNQLTSVTIPPSVETIYDYAFQDNNLTTIAIPNSTGYIAIVDPGVTITRY